MTSYINFSDISATTSIGLAAATETVYQESGQTGYTFELLGFDISKQLQVDPSFAIAIAQAAGLGVVDAIVDINVAASSFDGMFQIKLDSSDILDASASDILYGVSADFAYPDVSYSKGTVSTGNMNDTAGYNQTLEYDLVRHLAYSVTGGYAAADIFSNEVSLRNDVVSRDAEFNASFQTVLDDLETAGFKSVDNITNASSSELIAAVNLLTVTLNDSTGSYARRTTILEDISAAGASVTGEIQVPLKFVAGDQIVMRLNYQPQSETPIGANPISDRSYKVVATLT